MSTDRKPVSAGETDIRISRPGNLDEAFALFEARTNLEKGLPLGNPAREYRLDRMRALCEAFGNPQDACRVVHIAGSKGKGSTAAYIASLLSDAGFTTGIYSSPHLVDYRERFRIRDTDFPEEEALETARELLGKLPGLENELPGDTGATTFELLTLFAFLLFVRCGCEFAVLETGLGGRLDATNVVARPEAVILTPIEREHIEILGRRLTTIAGEKAGIMKPGVPVWSAAQKASVRRVFRRRAAEQSAVLTFMDRTVRNLVPGAEADAWQVQWADNSRETFRVSMGGRIQAENAVLALAAVRGILTRRRGGRIRPDVLAGVSLPGRGQLLRRMPPVMIDGAHTTRSVAAVAESFCRIAGEDPVLLFGSVLGKDHPAMARVLCGGPRPFFTEVIISTPGTFKPSDPPSVAESFRRAGRRRGPVVRLIPDPADAWKAALESAGDNRGILVTGSFFMAGEIAALAAD